MDEEPDSANGGVHGSNTDEDGSNMCGGQLELLNFGKQGVSITSNYNEGGISASHFSLSKKFIPLRSTSRTLNMKVQLSLVLLLALSHQGLAWLKRTKSDFGVGINKRNEKGGVHQGTLYILKYL